MEEKKYEILKKGIEDIQSMDVNNKYFKDVVILISSIQNEDGTFKLINSSVPNDINDYYNNETMYICASIYIKLYLYDKEWFEENIGIEKLEKVLNKISKTFLCGHGYDALSVQIKYMKMFIDCGVKSFIDIYYGINESFTYMIILIITSYQERIRNNNFNYGFGNYEKEIKEVIEKYEK